MMLIINNGIRHNIAKIAGITTKKIPTVINTALILTAISVYLLEFVIPILPS